MTTNAFMLSAFGDEIADDPLTQLQTLNDLQIGYLDLRAAWGKNVLDFTADETATLVQMCRDHGVAISSIGSPVGKSPILRPREEEMNNLARIFATAEAAGTRLVRVFSFYPPQTQSNADYDRYLDEAIARVAAFTELAASAGFTLLLENEKEIVGDTVARCRAILDAVASPHLRFVWDPANFVQVNEAHVTERGWPVLGKYTDVVHVKDALLADGSVTVAGAGDGQVAELLTRLSQSGRPIWLALEPHLTIAGHSGGFSGVDGMTTAAQALHTLLDSVL